MEISLRTVYVIYKIYKNNGRNPLVRSCLNIIVLVHVNVYELNFNRGWAIPLRWKQLVRLNKVWPVLVSYMMWLWSC